MLLLYKRMIFLLGGLIKMLKKIIILFSFCCLSQLYCDDLVRDAIINGEFSLLYQLNSDQINSVDGFGRTPIFYACSYGEEGNIEDQKIRRGMVSILLKAGAKVDLIDKEENTPATLAFLKRDFVVTNVLLSKGSKLFYDEKEFNLIIDLLFHAIEKKNKNLINFLIQGNEYCVFDFNSLGQSIFHILAKKNNYKLTEYFIDFANKLCDKDELLIAKKIKCLNSRDKTEKRPLNYAIDSENSKITNLLITNGASLKFDSLKGDPKLKKVKISRRSKSCQW